MPGPQTHRLRWYAAVALTSFPVGLASAVGALGLSTVQSGAGLPGVLVLAPLLIGPLAAWMLMRRFFGPTTTFDRVLGPVVFVGLTLLGILSVANWIAMQDHA
ncbi:MAG: hypothetical protein JNL41_08910 [Phenylobacterium sp.]|uniref:hypothetical protein n=1 Tax=Phenylobacterium sp. TaxID=1871053 RepID=UPI001A51A89D|nr:hypothetical protein [Phenylobacterium sp.]MBL8554384.1 hypothetical protein [Phenylobacterium sp.]